MSKLTLPKNYVPILNIKQTEQAILLAKEAFQEHLTAELRLRRVTAPLIVLNGTGVNDDLNGIERKVSFPVKDLNDRKAEVVNSLAKWKRMALADYKIEDGYGVLTDMNALRPDEELDNIHSIYVDQWDWELNMNNQPRDLAFLKQMATRIYQVLKRVEFVLFENYPTLTPSLPEQLTFIHAEELLKLYPNKTPKEREYEFVKKHEAVFIIGIGGLLSNNEKHDGRAPDYDDWTTQNENGFCGLNGDIMLYNSILDIAFEISSMGIRVNKEALLKQLQIANAMERKDLSWHKRLLNNEFPQSIGGGIGQSRVCMYLLHKAHIGEVQSSIWPDEMIVQCNKNNIPLF